MRTTHRSRFAGHPARRVSILLSIKDHAGHGSLMVNLMQRARLAGLSGATAFQGRHGFGSSGQIHQPHLLSDDSPVTVVIVDAPDAISAYLDGVADLLQDVLVATDDIDIVEF